MNWVAAVAGGLAVGGSVASESGEGGAGDGVGVGLATRSQADEAARIKTTTNTMRAVS